MGLTYNMTGGGGGGIKLASIDIVTAPTKTTYTAGETFDPAGMVVRATYDNGATLDATGVGYVPSGALADGMTSVTIQYTEGGVTKTATQAITVIHRLESIAVTTQPAKTAYEYSDSFQSAGMVVQATYSDGATANVSGYTCSPTTLTSLGNQTITVSYAERGVTKTTTLSVTVARKTIGTMPSQSGTLTYSGSAQSPSWNNYDAAKMTLGGVTSGTGAGSYNATFTPTANYRWSDGTTGAKTVAWTIKKAAGSLSLNPDSLTLDMNSPSKTITVTRAGDGAITASSNNQAAATVSVSGNVVTVTGVANGSATITVNVAEGTNHLAPASKTAAVEVSFVSIYGVQWDGTSSPVWSRTDDAQNFTDPVPYVAGATSYSSPFDNCMPWKGIKRVTDAEGGELVEIPKFWYKWTRSGTTMKLQIATAAETGFLVSPAHADRGDGKGERDVVYVGRYHCGSSYKSVTGQSPKANITRATARSSISALGSTIWQFDYAMLWTIRMLYLVEFAHWNVQEKIGYGCGNNSGAQAVGASDSMPYHTGTMQSSRTTYGVGVQYRYIEGLWDNVYDWCDGIYFSSSTIYGIRNPASFSDSSGGTNIGTCATSSGVPSKWTTPTATGFEGWLYPSEVSGTDYSIYACDRCNYYASLPVLFCGGYYSQYQYYGLFCTFRGAVSVTDAYFGCRLQKLP